MHKFFKTAVRFSIISFAITMLSFQTGLAQGPWTMELNFNTSNYRHFVGWVDGVSVDIPMFETTYTIESTMGNVSGDILGSSEDAFHVEFTPDVRCDNVTYEHGVVKFYGTLCTLVQPSCPGPGARLTVACTVSPAASGYIWEVTDDIQTAAAIETLSTNYGSIDVVSADLGGLNVSGDLYARVNDPACPGAISAWSPAFKFHDLPAVFDVTGGGAYCAGGSGESINLSGSETGHDYQLKVNGADAGEPVPGTGSALTWNNQVVTGQYTIMAINSVTGCSQLMQGSATVTILPPPAQFSVSGGGVYCPGGEDTPIALNGSQTGVDYQLQKDGVATGTPVAGSGDMLIWNNETASGDYSVIAIDQQGCVRQMAGTAAITMPANTVLPVSYTVSGGGTYCGINDGVEITLSSSEPGIDYDLMHTNSNGQSNAYNRKKSGTGSSLTWERIKTPGTFTVLAANATTGCRRNMNGNAAVELDIVQIDQTFLDTWSFQYEYDDQRRMIKKKVPGAGWVYMVYDNRDRLVMTQDGNQREAVPKEWTFTKYDALNRPVLTGIYQDTEGLDQDGMQLIVNAFYETVGQTGSTAKWHEEFTGTGGVVHGYTCNSFPDDATGEAAYLTVTYYDNYAFADAWGTDYEYTDDGLSETVNGVVYSQPDEESLQVTGQITGTRVKNLDDNTWLGTVNYYDNLLRVVQAVMDNHLGGLDRTSSLYDFVGNVLKTRTTHTRPSAGDRTVSRKFEYDHAGRLLTTWHKTGTEPEVLLTKNVYNRLGELITKKLHSEDEATFEQAVDYRYNIRGWLTRINDAALTADDANDPHDLFGMDLFYNHPDTDLGNEALYNGNISAIKWSINAGLGDAGLGQATQRAYVFEYDTLNRLKAAVHSAYTAGWNASPAFHEKDFKYDLNGNIRALTRTAAGGSVMDVLTYDYGSGTSRSNQLLGVADNGDVDNGFKDGNITNNDYDYDANGNMVFDKNKDIDLIEYNYLNLPSKVVKGTEYLKYIYDATGRKLRQEVYDATNTPQKTSDYAGEFFYENGVLQFINHEEGRVVMTGTEPEYQYHLKDHLGNVRLTFTTQEETDEATATLETSHATTEQSEFLNYAEVHTIDNPLFDHTNEGGTYNAVRLMGGNSTEVYGLAKSLSVMPGDTIHTEVYAKYLDPETANWTTALHNVINAIAGTSGAGGTYVDGGAMGTIDGTFPYPDLLTHNDNGTAPKAYLNFLVFDRDMNFTDGGYEPLTTAARESGQDLTNGEGVAHELLSATIPVKEPGYVYIYLSNEHENLVEVFFDDFRVEHVQGSVVQVGDYYPFGLAFNEYQRENSIDQKYLYNGKELQDELDIGWLDYGARMYMPEIGRWGLVDPLGEKMPNFSPFNYTWDNPILFIDPDGMFAPIYDTNGEFLGTDDQGLQGKAIVMDKKDFTQGMSHKDALSKSKGIIGLESDAAGAKLLNHFEGLKDRPDYDGFVSISEGIEWAKTHPGAARNPTSDNMLYIDVSQLDFGAIYTSDFESLNEPTPVNLFNVNNLTASVGDSDIRATVYALGRVNLILHGWNTREVSMVNDIATDYDWNRGGSSLRRTFIDTERARASLNDEHGFKVYYYGRGKLNLPFVDPFPNLRRELERTNERIMKK